jgi:hypothetical protein
MANLTNANLFKANLNYTDMHEANCENANMQEVTLQNSILEFANLQKANLQKADFKRARLDNCNLRGADLRNAKMGTYDSFDVDMGMVVSLEGANLSNANLQGADLQNANLSHANLQGADLRNTNLTGARLDKTQFFAKVTIENISKQLEEIGMHTQGHAQIHELRQAVANDLVAKLKDNADAIKILDIAISNSLFTHRNAISGAVNFIGSIFTADIVPSDSQKILILAKNELLKNQEQLYRKRL